MSDDYHRPTYTSADASNNPTNSDGYYNPTQVRLYGIPGQPGNMLASEAGSITGFPNLFKIEIQKNKLAHSTLSDEEWAKHRDAQIALLQDFLAVLKKSKGRADFEAFARERLNLPVPLPIPFDKEYLVTFDSKTMGPITVFASKRPPAAQAVSSGIIFGYAYEGHTYDFPKPKLMFLPTYPLSRIPADDSGYTPKEAEGYKVWIVDKLDQCIEIEINQGFVEQLVLEANLPGKRSPTMYGAKMALAHRSGRLTE